MRLLDLFSGIGGFHKGFTQAVAEKILLTITAEN
tara:strand:+ start:17410 stop:17511 length:102 start_codon:yes stop_codon:yes gene_type:complete